MPTPAPKSKSKSTGSSNVSKSTHVSKPKTRVPLAVHEQKKRLFKTLVAQIDGGHNLNAIKTCDKILRLAPSDPDALQTKLFLLLSTDQPAAAITLIESLNEEGANAFERAYALYCLNKRDEARDALPQTSAEVDERGARHLEAQLDYREGAYQAAFDIYNDLLDSAPTAEEQADILTNIQAASSHLDFINTTFLHSLDALPTHLQTQLEDAPPPALPSSAPAVQVAAEPVKAALPKEKKVRLPKGVVLGVTPPPDPERWLKKSERSNLGQKRRKGGGGGGGATQGSAADVPSAADNSGGGGGGGGKGGNAKGKGKKKK